MKLFYLTEHLEVLTEGLFPPRHILMQALEQKFPKRPEEWYVGAIKWMLNCDPVAVKSSYGKTPYLKNVLKWWLSKQITLPEDIDTVRETLHDLHQLRNSNPGVVRWLKEVGASNKDPIPVGVKINEVRKTLEQFTERKYDKFDYLQKVAEDGLYAVYRVDNFIDGPPAHAGARGGANQVTHKAFEGTRWCVRYKGTFESYKPPYFLFTRGGSKLGLMHFDSRQFKDPNDTCITAATARELEPLIKTVLPPAQMREILIDGTLHSLNLGAGKHFGDFKVLVPLYDIDVGDNVRSLVYERGDLDTILRFANTTGEAIEPKWEARIPDWILEGELYTVSRKVQTAFEYANNVKRARWPEIEAKFELPRVMQAVKDGGFYGGYDKYIQYAADRLGGRWRPLEALLIDCAANTGFMTSGVDYSVKVLHQRWPEFEKVLFSKVENVKQLQPAVRYLTKLVGERVPAFEQAILAIIDGQRGYQRDALATGVRYASGVIHGRWPELEKRLVIDPADPAAAEYMHKVLGGQWPELESLVLQALSDKPRRLFLYIKAERKSRWPEAEPFLQRDQKVWSIYKREFDIAQGPPGQFTRPIDAIEYALSKGEETPEYENLILKDPENAIRYARDVKGPWSELEQRIIKADNPFLAFTYANEVLHDEWPEAEAIIKRDPTLWPRYEERMKQ